MLSYMLVTFGLLILFQFPSDPCFIRWYNCFLLQNISSICHRWCSSSVTLDRTRAYHEGGGRAGFTWEKKRLKSRKTILVFILSIGWKVWRIKWDIKADTQKNQIRIWTWYRFIKIKRIPSLSSRNSYALNNRIICHCGLSEVKVAK